MNALTTGRLAIQKIMIGCFDACFKAYALSDWQVMEFANPVLTKANKVILLNCISSRRVGFQGHSYSAHDSSLKLLRTDDWLEEQLWQIHCICKRGTPDAMLPEDMAELLVTWYNGEGCNYLRSKGIASVRIDFMNVFVYNDDSDLYQKRAVFTVKIQVPKELTMAGIEPLDMVKPEVYPV